MNVRVGGFYRLPRKAELAALADSLRGSARSRGSWSAWTAGLDFPSFEHDYEFVALRHETEYPMNEGRLVSGRGLDIAMDEFLAHFEEYQVPYSNALQCRHKGSGAYFVGPLSRWNLNADQLRPSSRTRPRDGHRVAVPEPLCRASSSAALETVYAVEEALRIIEAYEPPGCAVRRREQPAPARANGSPRPRAASSTTATRRMRTGW